MELILVPEERSSEFLHPLLLKCRLCLLSEKEELVDLFSEAVAECNIVNKLNIHCNVIVTENDSLSKFICLSCLDKINNFSEFYNRIQENQIVLTAKRDESEEKIEVLKIDYDNDVEINRSSDSEESCVYMQLDKEDDLSIGSETNRNRSLLPVEGDVAAAESDGKEVICKSAEESPQKSITESSESNLIECIAEISSRKWLKSALKFSKNKEGLRNLLEQYNAKSKVLVLPSQKSSHRISLDEPIREFFELSCPHCNFAFLTFVTMKKHMESAHNEQGFLICCSKKLYRREAVMEHINYHLNPNKFVCDICKQVCRSKVTLKVHLKQHIPEDQRPFRCQTCGQSFVLNSQLKSHEKSHLTDEEKKYVCEKCGKAFAFKFVLEKHKQHKHIRQKNFMCEICAKSFVDKVNLTAHKRTHDSTLPRVKCPHCDALLKNKITLKIHMRTHNPERHSCSKCDKVLSTKNALMNHMQYVHGGKRYPCAVCQKVFKKTLTLKEHMTTHTGEVLYKCQYCDKSFNAKANMYSHVKKTHTLQWAEQRKLKWGSVN